MQHNECYTNPITAHHSLGLGSLFISLLRINNQLELWLERSRQRRQLLELDEHLLKDIGISRSEAEQEGAKPFWKE